MPQRFSLKDLAHPILQAPMAGSGITTTELVIAVSRAGGLGSIAGAYRSLAQIRNDIAAVRKATQRPFGVNIFAPVPTPARPVNDGPMLQLMSRWCQRYGLPAPELPEAPQEPFEQQLELLLAEAPPVVSFTFGLFPKEAVTALHQRHIFVIGTATSVEEARQLAETGVDAVHAQGAEAGGHRGSFTAENHAIGTMALVPQIVDAVDLPVIASGGIMDGRGIVAALALGAQAVQLGTAFLVTHESGAPASYKHRVLHSRETELAFTRAFSGRVARGIRNELMSEIESTAEPLSYPWQNALTRALRAEGVRRDDAEVLSLWAGQGLRMAREEDAATLVHRLVEQAAAVRNRLIV